MTTESLRGRRRALFALASSASLLRRSIAQEATARGPFVVNDSWHFRRFDLMTKNEEETWRQMVVSVDNDGAWLLHDSALRGRSWLRWDNQRAWFTETWAWREDAPAQRGSRPRSVVDPSVRWPPAFKVGERWSHITRFGSASAPGRVEIDYRVDRAEGIDTAAGHFDALRIEGRGNWTHELPGRTFNGPWEATLWFAPAAKRLVREESRSTWSDRRGQRHALATELVEFKLG